MVLLWREDTFVESGVTNYLALCDLGFMPSCAVRAPQPFPESTLEIRNKKNPPDFFYAGNLPVVSDELRKLLLTFNVDTEFLPLKTIVKKDKTASPIYWLVNILDVVECFDYSKSEYEQTDTGVTSIETIVLNDAAAVGHHLFLVGPRGMAADRNPRRIRHSIKCVSEELATAVINAEMTGVVFVRPEHERNRARDFAWIPDA